MLKRDTIYTLLFIVTLTSCVKDLDFDQAENFLLTPVYTSSILFTEVEASNFFKNGTELETVMDSVANIEIFEDQFVKDNLIKAELIFETTNTINRTLNLQVDFLNDADELQHTLTFDALESNLDTPVITDYSEVLEGDNLESLKLITKMVITLTLYPSTDGSTLNENSTGSISLNSKGIFYFNIEL